MLLASIALLLAASLATTASIYAWLHGQQGRKNFCKGFALLSLFSAARPVVMLAAFPAPPPYQPALFLKYERRLCTGIGDRMSVFLSVAAMARAVNASCYVYW